MKLSTPRFQWLAVVLLVLVVCGCGTTRTLKRHTTNHAETAMDIHRQQVLDNLARFVFDPHSIPSFAIASGGQTLISDQARGSLQSLSWSGTAFSGAVMQLGGQRQANVNWNLTAVTDPRRLELMRCAFQRSVANCNGAEAGLDCPECMLRFNRFYTGFAREPGEWTVEPRSAKTEGERNGCKKCDEGHATTLLPAGIRLCQADSETDGLAETQTPQEASLPEPTSTSPRNERSLEVVETPSVQSQGTKDDAKDSGEDKPESGAKNYVFKRVDRSIDRVAALDNGIVSSNCLIPGCCGWFGHGPKECVPKDCDCTYVGSHCGTYVWVHPGIGREHLTRLTLAILDYAVNPFPAPSTKEVVLYRRVDSDGVERPATKSDATKKVTVITGASNLAERALRFPQDRRRYFPPKPRETQSAIDNWRKTLQELERNGEIEMFEIDNLPDPDDSGEILEIESGTVDSYGFEAGSPSPAQSPPGRRLLEGDIQQRTFEAIQRASPSAINPLLTP